MKKIISVVPALLLGISVCGARPCSLQEIDMINESILDMQASLQAAEDAFAQYMNNEQGDQTLKQLFLAMEEKDENGKEKDNSAKVKKLATPQNVNSREAGKTPLIRAVELKRLDYVNILLEKGADVNLPNATTGATPLMLASFYLNEPIIRLLQTKRIDATATDNNGRTPVGYVYRRVERSRDKTLSDGDVTTILKILTKELNITPTSKDMGSVTKCTP